MFSGNVGSGQRKPTKEVIDAVFEIIGCVDALQFVRGRSLGPPFDILTEGECEKIISKF